MRVTMKASYVVFASIMAVGCGPDGSSGAKTLEGPRTAPARSVPPTPAGHLVAPATSVQDSIDIAPAATDDGVCQYALDECGFCDESGCRHQSFGAGTEHPFDAASAALGGAEVTVDGSATAADALLVDDRFIWIPDSREGTVAKVDTASGVELGRYRTAGSRDSTPVAVAASPRGFALVANRMVGTVVRIDASNCTDRDADGMVRTSSGPADVLPWGHDECVSWSTSLDQSVRAIALEERIVGAGRREVVWAALGDGQIVEVDASNGEPTSPRLSVVPASGYPFTDLAMGRDGQLWLMSKRDLGQLDTATRTLHTWSVPGATSLHALTVAPDGTPWLAGSGGAYYFDRVAEVFEAVDDDCGGAIAVGANGVAWIASGEACAPAELRHVDPAGAVESHHDVLAASLAFDFSGLLWAIDPTGSARRFLAANGQGDPVWQARGPGFHFAEGDMTGAQLTSVMEQPARLATSLSGCEAPQVTDWALLRYRADVPPGTRLTLELRSADTTNGLAAATPITIDAPAIADENDIDLREVLALAEIETGRLLEVTATFETPAHQHLPSLQSFDVFYACDER